MSWRMGRIPSMVGHPFAIAAAQRETDPINRQSPMSTIACTRRLIYEAAIYELDKLLSVPLNSPMIKVLDIENYSDLLTSLLWYNRFQVSVVMLMVVLASGKVLTDVG